MQGPVSSLLSSFWYVATHLSVSSFHRLGIPLKRFFLNLGFYFHDALVLRWELSRPRHFFLRVFSSVSPSPPFVVDLSSPISPTPAESDSPSPLFLKTVDCKNRLCPRGGHPLYWRLPHLFVRIFPLGASGKTFRPGTLSETLQI